ncbi:MAG: membrane protein insertion efficiency factor YidD [Dorea sp.]|nr:membrane protein insertion efficiency factor YidD [Dorea sp.]
MKKILLACINFYRRHLSSMKGYSSCKYYPTCSTYALEAIEKYGAVKGGYLAVRRILRCNPFSKGGYDPVP